jgi:hypothetical protein
MFNNVRLRRFLFSKAEIRQANKHISSIGGVSMKTRTLQHRNGKYTIRITKPEMSVAERKKADLVIVKRLKDYLNVRGIS